MKTEFMKAFTGVLLSIVMIINPIHYSEASSQELPVKYAKSIQNMEATLTESMEGLGNPPSSIVLMEDGKVFYNKTFGKADKVNNIDLNENTLFNIGSVSKIYVTAAMLKLNQDGKLSIDEHVTKYIPEFEMADKRYKDITVKMLLNHSSGLPGTSYNNSFLIEDDTNKEYFKNLIVDLKDEELKAVPGDYIVYCNEGFILAQHIIETVSGTSYEAFLKENFFKAMGIKNTYLSSDSSLNQKEFAKSYDAYGNVLGRECVTEALAGTGGISTTSKELAVFADKLLSLETGILNGESIELFRENQALNTKFDKESTLNALGWDQIDHRISSTDVYTKGGGTMQYLSQLAVAPDEDITMVGISTRPSQINEIITDCMYDVLSEKGIVEKNSKKIFVPDEAKVNSDVSSKAGNYVRVMSSSILKAEIDSSNLLISIFTHGNWEPINTYKYKKDGAFWSEPSSRGEYQRITFKELGGKTYIVQNFLNGNYDYCLLFGERLASGRQVESWKGLNNTTWLQLNVKPNSIDMGDLITKLSSDVDGYVTFVLDSTFKIESEANAGAISRVARDTGKVMLKGNHIAFRGYEFVNADNIPIFDNKRMESFKLDKTDIAQWYKIEKSIEITSNLEYRDVRILVFDNKAVTIFDNANQSGNFKVPAGSFILFSGKAGNEVDLNINEIEEK